MIYEYIEDAEGNFTFTSTAPHRVPEVRIEYRLELWELAQEFGGGN